MHADAFETSTDHGFALGFDHAGGDAEAEGAESWVVHPVLVVGKVIEAFAGLVAGGGVDVELGEDAVEVALVEFVTALFGPMGGEVGMDAIDGVGDIEEVLFGVVDVDDLEGVGGGPVPDPGGAVAEDDALGDLIEAAASGFTEHAAGKGGGRGVGVAAGDAFDSGIAGDRIRVAHGQAVFVSGLGGPDDGELGFTGFGGAVGLFALASLGFGVAPGDAGAVESEIEGGSLWGFEFEDLAFIEGNGLTEGLGKRSTCLGWMSRQASSRKRLLASAKLTRAALTPVIRKAAGDREAPSRPRARSRGLKPVWQCWQ